MTKDAVLELLGRKAAELGSPLPLTWRYPRREPAKPLAAKPGRSWKALADPGQEAWRKDGPNWFYADLQFPRSRCGVRLGGREALCFVHGWQPFTLWIDGEEIWKEQHAWMASGPIADPFPFPVVAGRRHRLAMCVVPTELPSGHIAVNVHIVPRACLELQVDLEAAAAELRVAAQLAATDAERDLVARAEGCVDAQAVSANRWGPALASLERMEKVLEPFSERAKQLTVHLVGHSHIDMDWMWTWPDTVNCIRRDFKAVTDLMDDDPRVTFTHSQVPTYEVGKREDPAVFAKIRRRVAEGRWENVAGTWVEGDLNMADGESIARHMLYAKTWTRRHLGSEARVLWEPDTFGHPGNLPQLARLGEFDGYFHMRCHPNKENQLAPADGEGAGLPQPARIWTGVDGTSIPALSLVYNSDLMPGSVADRALRAQRQGLANGLHVWGLGDHGGSLSRLQVEFLDRYRERPLIPSVRFSTVSRVLAAIDGEGVALPGNRGETYNLFEGCFTTHASLKWYNRRCEGALLAAEALSALAGMDAGGQLRKGWTPALFNHFHDLLDGAAVHDAYINVHKRAERSLRIAARVTREAAGALAGAGRSACVTGPTGGPGIGAAAGRKRWSGGYLTVLNPLGFERTGPVRVALPRDTVCLEDSEGRICPVQPLGQDHMFVAKGVPAFGSKVYRLRKRAPGGGLPAPVRVEEDRRHRYYNVETSSALVRLGRDSGVIGQYFDKRLERELVAYGFPIPLSHTAVTHSEMALNVFQVSDEAPNPMTAWHIDNILRTENLLRGAEVTLEAAGPVFAMFRVVHAFRASRIEEDMVFYRDVPRVDFEARIDWRERGNAENGVPQLKVGFGTDMAAARCRTEGPFVVREIPANGMEKPTQKWADLSGDGFGFTMLNDSKYGMDALGGRLRLTLLRNAYSPDPETDNGHHTVRFAFAPHDGTRRSGDLVRAGMEYNRELVAVLSNRPGNPVAAPLVVRRAPDIVCTALRRAEFSDEILVRLFNAGDRGCTARVRWERGLRRARAVNFLENPTGDPIKVAGDEMTLGFRPFEVKTIALREKREAT